MREISEDGRISLAGGPALRAVTVPDRLLRVPRRIRIPDWRELHAGIAEAAHDAVVGDAGIHGSPRVDEAAGAQRMTRQRRRSSVEEPIQMVEKTLFEPRL